MSNVTLFSGIKVEFKPQTMKEGNAMDSRYYLHYTYCYRAYQREYDDYSDAISALYDMLDSPSYGRYYQEAFVDCIPQSQYDAIDYSDTEYAL